MMSKNILRVFGEIGIQEDGWKKLVALIQQGDGLAHYDVRTWSPNETRFGEGIKLSREELIELKYVLNEMNLGEITEGWD